MTTDREPAASKIREWSNIVEWSNRHPSPGGRPSSCYLVRFELLPSYRLSMVDADDWPPATTKNQNNRVSYCRVLYVLLITLLSTWRIVWREGFSCCGGKASIFWREGRSFGGKILFFGGKVIAARQLRPCCKVVLARSLRWSPNPRKCKVVLARSLQSSSINDISHRNKYEDCM